MTSVPSDGPPADTSIATPPDGAARTASPALHDAVVRAAVALLAPEQMAEVVANRIVIEQLKGMLMMIYGIDADDAFDLIRSASRTSHVRVRLLAEQLTQDLMRVAQDDQVDTRSACDALLLTVDQRVGGDADGVSRP